jgi:hypothetical protein
MGEATVGTGTRTAVSGDERPFLPGMSREWLPPLYDPLTRLLGVHRRLLDRDGRPPMTGSPAGPTGTNSPRENVGGGIPDLLRRAGFTDVSETGSDVRRHVGRFTFYRAVA